VENIDFPLWLLAAADKHRERHPRPLHDHFPAGDDFGGDDHPLRLAPALGAAIELIGERQQRLLDVGLLDVEPLGIAAPQANCGARSKPTRATVRRRRSQRGCPIKKAPAMRGCEKFCDTKEV
jgi:hypothetical protein